MKSSFLELFTGMDVSCTVINSKKDMELKNKEKEPQKKEQTVRKENLAAPAKPFPGGKWVGVAAGLLLVVGIAIWGYKAYEDYRADRERLVQMRQDSIRREQQRQDSLRMVKVRLAEQRRQAVLAEWGMVFVQGGTFTMGATSEQGSDASDDEKPAHRVTVSDFYIGKYEVTQAQWDAVMGGNSSRFWGANLPVDRASWEDCQKFIRKLNERTGLRFRLPTEAEWEYAARGGNKSRGYKYSGSNDINQVAWYRKNSRGKTHPVGQKAANELGLYDMSGNVNERCSDWFGEEYYKNSPQMNPSGPGSGDRLGLGRAWRGGCWRYYASGCCVSMRGFGEPKSSYANLGLRLVLDL